MANYKQTCTPNHFVVFKMNCLKMLDILSRNFKLTVKIKKIGDDDSKTNVEFGRYQYNSMYRYLTNISILTHIEA